MINPEIEKQVSAFLNRGKAFALKYNLPGCLNLVEPDQTLVFHHCSLQLLRQQMSTDADTFRSYDEQTIKINVPLPLFLDPVAMARKRYQESEAVIQVIEATINSFVQEKYPEGTRQKAHTIRLAINMLFASIKNSNQNAGNDFIHTHITEWAEDWKLRLQES